MKVPVGAVIVREGRVIARAFNQVELLKDATAHAENPRAHASGACAWRWRLDGSTLYVTKSRVRCAPGQLCCRVSSGWFSVSRIPRAVEQGQVFDITAKVA